MGGLVGQNRCLFPFGGRLGLAALDQEFPARADVVLVQAADHGRVDLPVQAERRGALPGPLTGRFPGRGVVRHGPGAATAALPGGEVGDVVARVQRHIRGHDPSPPALVSAFIVRDACVRSVSWVMTDSKAGSRTICGFTEPLLTGEGCGGSHPKGRKSGAVTVPALPAGGVTGQPDASALRPACLSRPRGGAQGPSSGSTKRPVSVNRREFLVRR